MRKFLTDKAVGMHRFHRFSPHWKSEFTAVLFLSKVCIHVYHSSVCHLTWRPYHTLLHKYLRRHKHSFKYVQIELYCFAKYRKLCHYNFKVTVMKQYLIWVSVLNCISVPSRRGFPSLLIFLMFISYFCLLKSLLCGVFPLSKGVRTEGIVYCLFKHHLRQICDFDILYI